MGLSIHLFGIGWTLYVIAVGFCLVLGGYMAAYLAQKLYGALNYVEDEIKWRLWSLYDNYRDWRKARNGR